MDATGVARPSASVEDRQVGLQTNYANRELLLNPDSGRSFIGAPNIPLLAIRGWLCIRCLAHTPDLKACGACKRVRYCSERCQKVDWKRVHKKHCQAFRHINLMEDEPFAQNSPGSWGPFRDWLNMHMTVLAEITDKDASSIFGSQAYCNTCYRSEYLLRVHHKAELDSCKHCHVAFKCRQCLTWNHSDQTCEFYQLSSSEQLFSIDVFNETGNITTKWPIPFSQTFTEMASLNGWFDYFQKLHGEQEIGAYVEPNGFGFAPSRAARRSKDVEKFALNSWAGLRVATDAGCISMTIANALYIGLPDLRAKSSLLIHIIGAGPRELNLLMMFEEILHLFPNLGSIRTVLIGPNTAKNTGKDGRSESHDFIDQDCCPQCTTQGRERFVALYRGLYHDFTTIKQYATPDLAILFQSGLTQCEVESWAPTIQFLVDQDILTACTTYTKSEAVEEIVHLSKVWKAKIVQRFEENKWRSLIPLLETGEGAEHSVYYADYYWYMFRGKA